MKKYTGSVEITTRNAKEWEKKLANCEEITGYLSIYSNADLKALKSVGGNLSIYSNADLKALKSVGGNLSIYSNADLKAPNLKSVGGDLYIYSKISNRIAGYLLKKYSQKREWYLSSDANESLLKADIKNVKYSIEGVDFEKKLFNRVRKDKLSAGEVFALANIEQRRIAYGIMDKVKMKDLTGYKVLDTVKKDGKGKKMEIVTFQVEGYSKPFKYLHCIDASTDREYFVETDKDKCWEAKEGSFGLENVGWVEEW